MTGVNKQ